MALLGFSIDGLQSFLKVVNYLILLTTTKFLDYTIVNFEKIEFFSMVLQIAILAVISNPGGYFSFGVHINLGSKYRIIIDLSPKLMNLRILRPKIAKSH